MPVIFSHFPSSSNSALLCQIRQIVAVVIRSHQQGVQVSNKVGRGDVNEICNTMVVQQKVSSGIRGFLNVISKQNNFHLIRQQLESSSSSSGEPTKRGSLPSLRKTEVEKEDEEENWGCVQFFSQTFLTLFFPFASKIEIQDRETASCNGFRFFYEDAFIQLFYFTVHFKNWYH